MFDFAVAIWKCPDRKRTHSCEANNTVEAAPMFLTSREKAVCNLKKMTEACFKVASPIHSTAFHNPKFKSSPRREGIVVVDAIKYRG